MASFSILLKNIENSVEAKAHPCLTPLLLWKGWERSIPRVRGPSWPSWSCVTIARNFGGRPSLARIVHSPFLLSLLKDLDRSTTKVMYKSLFCSRHFSWSCAFLWTKYHVRGAPLLSNLALALWEMNFGNVG